MAMFRSGDLKKIVLGILGLVALITAGVFLIVFIGDQVGISVPIPIVNNLRSAALKKKIAQGEDPYLLEREELAKFEEKLVIKEEQIVNRELEIQNKEINSDKKLESILEKEKELEKKQKLLDDRDKEYSDRKTNIREQAVKLYNMPPVDAVKILEQQDEKDIVDILRAIDAYSAELGRQSTAPYFMKLMGDINKQKTANVLRKLKYSAGEADTSVESVEGLDDTIANP